MTATLPDADLASQLKDLQDRIRKNPADARLRIYLFQLLCVLGDWERAATQLELLADLDDSALAMVQTYREVLQCELVRQAVFAGRHTPLIFGQPEGWVALLIEALRATASGGYEAARKARDAAFEAAPASAGRLTLDGERAASFDWIADADSRLGPLLEAIVNGKYYWVPFTQIARIEIEPPSDLRDKVWAPVQFTWRNGGAAVGFVPSRYPGSEAVDDDAIRLARATRWEEPGEGVYLGLGQRMLATDVDEYALLDVRAIDLDAGEQGGTGDAAATGAME